MAAYRGIIFDFNGVLWWDGHLQEQAWKQFSAQIRGLPLSDQEMAVHVHGRDNRHTLAYLLGHDLEPEQLWHLSEQKETIYRRLCLQQGPGFALSPGTVELLGFLVAHHVGHAIATASGQENVDFFFEHLHLAHWFDATQIVCDDGSRPGKPAPDIYLEAAARLGLEPGQCVVVEDSQAGIQAARAAGIGYIVALGPAHTHPTLAHLAGVELVVDSLEQIPREQIFF
jgi:beta-phosphoglucomutase